ncbi:Tetracycline repressor protein class A from transposon [compost metagenome]
MNQIKSSYHHGDLRSSLLEAAIDLIRESGVEELSMRKLADRVGVSRTAPYHHFVDKHELLSVIAEVGFAQYEAGLNAALQSIEDPGQSLHLFLRYYLNFALEHPQAYNLMFGQGVWKSGQSTQALKTEAYRVFKSYVGRVEAWQKAGILPDCVDALRLAQISWSTLHGLCRLLLDGIYVDPHNLEDLLGLAENMFRQRLCVDGAATADIPPNR